MESKINVYKQLSRPLEVTTNNSVGGATMVYKCCGVVINLSISFGKVLDSVCMRMFRCCSVAVLDCLLTYK